MVELPCKVGDIVWYTGYGVYAIKCCVSALHISNFKEKNRLVIIDDYVVLRSPLYCARNGFMKKVKISEFGKTVFFTKEEAEKKLEELNNELN